MCIRPNRLELTVAVDRRGEPISGCVTDASGRRLAFSGWLDLMDVLDGERRRIGVQSIDEDATDETGS